MTGLKYGFVSMMNIINSDSIGINTNIDSLFPSLTGF